MATQFDLFAASNQPPRHTSIDPLHGLAVRLSDTCKCGTCDAVIGEGKKPHSAALFCSRCEIHRGWMANETHRFVTELIKKFGKPTTPIKIRRKQRKERL
jgi:hypothetical protein